VSAAINAVAQYPVVRDRATLLERKALCTLLCKKKSPACLPVYFQVVRTLFRGDRAILKGFGFLVGGLWGVFSFFFFYTQKELSDLSHTYT